MVDERSTKSMPAADTRSNAIVDVVFLVLLGVVTTALFAVIGDGVQLESLLLCAAWGALVMILGLRRGSIIGDFVRRLRERPNDLG